MTVFLIVCGVLLLLFALYLFFAFPQKAEKTKRAPYQNRYFAHRGLFNNKGELPPENTLEGFDAACRAGFGSELDVQFTSDGELIVFHDNDYKRACGVDKKVWDVTLAEAQSFKLFERDFKAPLFSEMLKTVDGRTPLIIEIKAEERDNQTYYELCRRVNEELADYKGEYCIESFNPFVVRWWRKNRPDVVRGQLLTHDYPETMPGIVRFMLKNLLLDFMGRPNFVAYNCVSRPRALDLNRKLGAMSVMWTVKSAADAERLEKNNDAIIFDSYLPENTYFKENK